jgi:EH domain-containing protein 1
MTSEGKKSKKRVSLDGKSEKDENAVNAELDTRTQEEIQNAHIIDSLKTLYKDKLLPIEKKHFFHKFNSAEILDAEIVAKPTVLLVGQYSTGKTSFIRHLIKQDYPGIHIGPEPTTDGFIAVVYGEEQRVIKGNALTGFNELPFSGLSVFGSSFLNKFSAAVVPAPVLKDINIVDTPGVLSGEKQRTSRGYDFAKVSRWFAERSDLILLLFDCSKLDISDEFKSVIEELQPHEDKVHCVLNKADQLDQESLMRVYGALLWSMGRILKGAEVARIYVGSFHDKELLRPEHATLFNKDQEALMAHISTLPKACSLRKINEMVKRIRLNIMHCCIVGYLKAKMPYLWGKEKKQQELIKKLDEVFVDLRRQYQLPEGDFPKVDEYRADLQLSDFSSFPAINRKTLESLQDMLVHDIPNITQLLSTELKRDTKTGNLVNKESQLPQMFQYREPDSAALQVSPVLAVAVALLAILVALLVASMANNHVVARQLWAQVLQTLAQAAAAANQQVILPASTAPSTN